MNRTTCIICDKTLGQDSRDSGWPTCHVHRECSICHKPLQVRELRIIISQVSQAEADIIADVLVHERCALSNIESNSIQSALLSPYEVSFLNRLRLCICPNTDLSEQVNIDLVHIHMPELVADMSMDQKFLFLRKLETAAGRLASLCSKDRGKIQADYEKKHHEDMEEVKKIREKSKDSKPTTGTNTYGYAERVWDNLSKAEKANAKQWFNGVKVLTSVGVPRATAEATVNAEFKKQGRLLHAATANKV